MDTMDIAKTELGRAQQTIDAARATRSPRGPAGQMRSTTDELQHAVDELQGELDSIGEMGEMDSLRLQTAMDRASKLSSTLSNMLKKASETSGQITQNLK